MGLVVSRKIMQPLSVELTDVNRRSKTKLTVKIQCFRHGGKKLNGSPNKAKILTVSYKSHHPTETITSKQRYTLTRKLQKKTYPKNSCARVITWRSNGY